jgi:hypothetical protein
MKILILITVIFSLQAFASDHIDGPVTTSHAVSDITDLYAFPSTDKKGFLTVILNTYPFVPSNGHFADKVSYEIFIKEASIENGITAKNGVKISCTFFTPYEHDKHTVECKSSGTPVAVAKAKVNAIEPYKPGSPIHVFAGSRSDPFFFNADWAKSVGNKGVIPAPKKTNTMDQLNVLSIVLDIDLKAVMNPSTTLFAIAAQTMTEGRRLDRIGRPEITNVTMNARDKADLRDQYNTEAPFEVSPAALDKYKIRMKNNITYYDGLDKKTDWLPATKDTIVALLANDFLVVDLSKPCNEDSFLEIEMAIVNGKTHQSCGGRHPNNDIMDSLFNYYVNNNSGTPISDGVSAPYREVSTKFPYLNEADTSVSAKLKALLARKVFAKP